jgi:hypothetical protein
MWKKKRRERTCSPFLILPLEKRKERKKEKKNERLALQICQLLERQVAESDGDRQKWGHTHKKKKKKERKVFFFFLISLSKYLMAVVITTRRQKEKNLKQPAVRCSFIKSSSRKKIRYFNDIFHLHIAK